MFCSCSLASKTKKKKKGKGVSGHAKNKMARCCVWSSPWALGPGWASCSCTAPSSLHATTPPEAASCITGTRVSLLCLRRVLLPLLCFKARYERVRTRHTSTHALADRSSPPPGVIMASTQLLCWCFVPCFGQKNMFRGQECAFVLSGHPE